MENGDFLQKPETAIYFVNTTWDLTGIIVIFAGKIENDYPLVN